MALVLVEGLDCELPSHPLLACFQILSLSVSSAPIFSFLFPSPIPLLPLLLCMKSVVWVIPGCSESDLIALSPPPFNMRASKRAVTDPSAPVKEKKKHTTKKHLHSKRWATLKTHRKYQLGLPRRCRNNAASALLCCDNFLVLCSPAEWVWAQYGEITPTAAEELL